MTGVSRDNLPQGDLELEGRLVVASNATFLGTVDGTTVVYKPVIGEKPLWDFPDRTLAHREVSASLLSDALGWDVVPTTWLRDGPFGTGMVQLWCDSAEAANPVDLVPAAETPQRLEQGWHHILDGFDENDETVSLIHEDSTALRHMAVFDVLANNADRKGGHILPLPGGHRVGVDHGLTFHTENKLRTVLWGWEGEPLLDDELDAVRRIRSELDGDLGETLFGHLAVAEVVALADRCDELLRSGRFPAPAGDMPAVPWPLF